jgi:hypothetical protein
MPTLIAIALESPRGAFYSADARRGREDYSPSASVPNASVRERFVPVDCLGLPLKTEKIMSADRNVKPTRLARRERATRGLANVVKGSLSRWRRRLKCMFLKPRPRARRSTHRSAAAIFTGFRERRGLRFATPIRRERFELYISDALV